MQSCDIISRHRSNGSTPDACRKSNFERPRGSGSPIGARTIALSFAEYLHEDLAQMLVAIKLNLERLAQNNLDGASLTPSIAALQGVIRHVSSLAEEIRPALAHRSGLRASVR